MKKRLLILVAAIITSVNAMAIGPVEFGIKAGINTGNFDLSSMKFDNAYWLINEAKTGYHAGAFMRVNFLGMHVQPEFMYNYNRYNMFVLTRGGGSEENTTKVRHQTLEVPVIVGFDLLFLRLGAGPVFNVMNRSSTVSGALADVDIVKPSVSYALGVGVDVFGISLDVRYNGQFNRAKQTITINSQSHSLKSNFTGWTFSVGYTF